MGFDCGFWVTEKQRAQELLDLRSRTLLQSQFVDECLEMSWRVPGVQPALRGHRSWSLKSPSDSSSDRCHSDRCTCSGRMELVSELPLLPTSSSSGPSAAWVVLPVF